MLKMTFGLFNKIKKGLGKVWNFGKKVMGYVKPAIDVGRKILPVAQDILGDKAPGFLNKVPDYFDKAEHLVNNIPLNMRNQRMVGGNAGIRQLNNDSIQPQFK